MENRLMLAAAASSLGDLGVADLDVGNVVALRVVKPAGAQPVLASPEGGFIRLTDSLVSFDSTVTSHLNANTGYDRSIDDLLNGDLFTGSDNVIDIPMADHVGSSSGGGLSPRVIDGDGGLLSGLPSHDGGEAQTGTNGTEGGMIAVDALLASLGSTSPQSDAPQPVTLGSWKAASQAFNTSVEALAQASDDDVTGEWARAAVFEITGSDALNTDEDSDRGPSAANFTTAIERAKNALSSSPVASEVDSIKPKAIVDAPPANIPVARQYEESLTADHDGTVAFDQGSDAHSDAREWSSETFDRLESDDESRHVPVFEIRRFSSTLSAVPLLLVFALERVSPRKWRRQQRVRQSQFAAKRQR